MTSRSSCFFFCVRNSSSATNQNQRTACVGLMRQARAAAKSEQSIDGTPRSLLKDQAIIYSKYHLEVGPFVRGDQKHSASNIRIVSNELLYVLTMVQNTNQLERYITISQVISE